MIQEGITALFIGFLKNCSLSRKSNMSGIIYILSLYLSINNFVVRQCFNEFHRSETREKPLDRMGDEGIVANMSETEDVCAVV